MGRVDLQLRKKLMKSRIEKGKVLALYGMELCRQRKGWLMELHCISLLNLLLLLLNYKLNKSAISRD